MPGDEDAGCASDRADLYAMLLGTDTLCWAHDAHDVKLYA
jgi:hypothetical protein